MFLYIIHSISPVKNIYHFDFRFGSEKMYHLRVFLAVFSAFSIAGVQAQSAATIPNFRIVTAPDDVFFMVTNGTDGKPTYSGFAVDLLDAMSKVGNFTYTISVVLSSAQYGTQLPNGSYTFALGALFDYTADVAVLTRAVTTARRRIIDFTVPFYQSQIQILYNKNTGLDNVKYVVQQGGIRSFLQAAVSPKGQEIWANIQYNLPDAIVAFDSQAVAKVVAGGYAFVINTPYIDRYIAQNPYILAKSTEILQHSFYGFGVLQNSGIRQTLDLALLTVQETGLVEQLLTKYGLR